MKVLLAVDGSAHSLAAVREVARRPWPVGSEIKLFHVLEPQPLPGYGGECTPRQIDQARRALDAALGELRPLTERGLSVSTEMVEGAPKLRILEEAEAWGADLIVVGSHGYSGLQRFLLGSVSQAVALHAKCSVEIARD